MNSTTFPILVIGCCNSGCLFVCRHVRHCDGGPRHAVDHRYPNWRPTLTDRLPTTRVVWPRWPSLAADVRARTDKLDAVGNTTAAIGKGFAIGSAALTALSLTAAFLTKMNGQVNLDAANPYVLVGLLIGCMLPFRFSAMAMVAVGKAAQDMIQEVRRQFKEIPELRPALDAAQRAESEERDPTEEEAGVIAAADGKADYSHCVDIATAAAIKKMVAPGLMAVIVPVVVGFYNVDMLGGLLIGVTIFRRLPRHFSKPMRAVPGTTPRSRSRTKVTASGATISTRCTRPRSSATRLAIRSRTPRVRRSTS